MDEDKVQRNRENAKRYYWRHREEVLAKSQAKRDAIQAEKKLEEEKKKEKLRKAKRFLRQEREKLRDKDNDFLDLSPVDNTLVKAVRQTFFLEFSEFHCSWLRELVAKYKERGVFPVYPTQIADYYTDKEDRIIAILSSFLMKWDNDNELEQIASMRKILGTSPYEWFKNREFVVLSIGREQNNKIDGYNVGIYWKIARLYDVLYDTCLVISDNFKPSEALKGSSLARFLDDVEVKCELSNTSFKREVIELVLKTTDGLGRGLLPTAPSKVKCPSTSEMRKYMLTWFPDYKTRFWSWEEAVRLFRLENDYDFFYAYLAHTELAKRNPKDCSKYRTRYLSRWEYGRVFRANEWKRYRCVVPEIKFETY